MDAPPTPPGDAPPPARPAARPLAWLADRGALFRRFVLAQILEEPLCRRRWPRAAVERRLRRAREV